MSGTNKWSGGQLPGIGWVYCAPWTACSTSDLGAPTKQEGEMMVSADVSSSMGVDCQERVLGLAFLEPGQ